MVDRIYFRASGGPKKGIGHVLRLASFARYASRLGWETHLILDSGSKDWVLNRMDKDPFVTVTDQTSFHDVKARDSFLVIDTYDSQLKAWVADLEFRKTISVIDPGYTPDFETDIRLYQSLDHPKIKKGDINQLIVDDYFFWLRRERHGRRVNNMPKILISPGSTDPHKYCLAISQILMSLNLEYDAVFVTAERMEILDSRFRQISFGSTYRDEIRNTDLVIAGAGTTVWELVAANVPFCFTSIFENQIANYRTLTKFGLGIPLGERVGQKWNISRTNLIDAVTKIPTLQDAIPTLADNYFLGRAKNSINNIFNLAPENNV